MSTALTRGVRSLRGWARLAAVTVAVLAVAGLVVSRSESAFSGATGNSGNNLATGSVVLTDNDSGGALFTVTGLTPGVATTRCIEVTYSGTSTLPGPIRLYGGYVDSSDAGTTADSALADYLDLEIGLGNPGVTCSTAFAGTTLFDSTTPTASAGTLARFTTVYRDWTNGLSTTWTPAGGSNEIRAFRITATVKDDNNAQSKNAEPSFTWEARG